MRNAAEGGASSLDLHRQATSAGVEEHDLVVVSVGTNDAAPWRRVPVAAFSRALSSFLLSAPAHRWVYLAPPGVDEACLQGSTDRTNAVLDEYRDAALSACDDVGAHVVRTERIIAPLGAAAFADDGLHLSGRAYGVVLPAVADALRSAMHRG